MTMTGPRITGILAAMVVTAAALPAHAVLVPLNTEDNSGVFVDIYTSEEPGDPDDIINELQSITLDGITYETSELIQITLTAFEGQDRRALAIPHFTHSPIGTNPTAQERRDLIETDWLASTGILNPSFFAPGLAADFKQPVTNGPGIDMFMYEMGGGDQTWITINGTEVEIPASAFGDLATTTGRVDLLDMVNLTPLWPATLDQLLNEPTKISSTSNIEQILAGVGIDFSDFGVADGETVTSFTMRSNGVDPVIIAGLPERTVVEVAGDYNGDGVVDPSDYAFWSNQYAAELGGGTGDLAADGNGDGVIDPSDYAFWSNEYAAVLAGGGAAVPEPATLSLLGLAGLAALRRRRA